jgi:neural Wiskott-Aldrich syndrome protein
VSFPFFKANSAALCPGPVFTSPSEFSAELPSGEHIHFNADAECASITQSTLLHTIAFYINTYVSFVNINTRTEQLSRVSIPIQILPPPAPLPEVAASMDDAYEKKHDRPPVKTNRFDESELLAPSYTEDQAGTSAQTNGAPPPFEERDAPPPFSTSNDGGGSPNPKS